MAILFEDKPRHVIPNWRSYKATAYLGELQGFNKGSIPVNSSSISDLEEEWKINKNIGVAADVVNSAIVLGLNNSTISEASFYILQNESQSSPLLTQSAEQILKQNSPLGVNHNNFDYKKIDDYNGTANLKKIYDQIHYLKNCLIQNPKNAILWVEKSRLHAVLGDNINSRKCMMIALSLNSDNRFILRSMTRLFAHLKEIDIAHDILRTHQLLKNDPWLIASEISLAQMRGRGSRFVKLGLDIIETNNYDPFNVSELTSSIATLELQNGSHKKSKKLFQQSLIKPNDNTLAQAEWASQLDGNIGYVNPSSYTSINSFEALARDNFEKESWTTSLDYCIKWFFDTPYSKAPIVLASNIATVFLEDYQSAINVINAGLVSHPRDPLLLNNLIYALCLGNRLNEAEKMLSTINYNVLTTEMNICLTATRGLFLFRKGLHDQGREFYTTAISKASEIKDQRLFNLALVNLAREEVYANTENAFDMVSNLRHLLGEEIGPTVKKIMEQTLLIYRANTTL